MRMEKEIGEKLFFLNGFKIFLCMILFLGMGFSSTCMAQTDMASYRWENRLILLFFPSETDQAYIDFDKKLNAEQAELADRDLLVFSIFEEGKSRVNQEPLSQKEVMMLRDRYDVSQIEKALILIGKDGGEKLRQIGSEISLEPIFPLIDGMPMRRREMRMKNEKL